MGAFSGVVVNVSLVQFVNAAHVRLKSEGTAHQAHAALLREKASVNHSAHRHVGAISHTQLLQIAPLILFKRTCTHLFSGVDLHVRVECLVLSGAVKAACL